MITEYLDNSIRNLVKEESENAIKKHGMFHSMPESYAVLAEEIEETREVLEKLEASLQLMWQNNRANDRTAFCQMAKLAGKYAREVAEEAVQASAVCAKVERSLIRE